MITVYVVSEGQVEVNFVKKVLSEYFANRCVFIPITVVTSHDRRHGRIYKGGINTYAQLEHTLIPIVKKAQKDKRIFVTTMIDFYGLPKDTPGVEKISDISNPYDKVKYVEEKIAEDKKIYNRFIPYIQLHEFETLLFVDLDKLAEVYFDYNIDALRQVVKKISNPEFINDGFQTAPSKRILDCVDVYNKANEGVDIVGRIGFQKLMETCKHFREWIVKIEKIVEDER